jgi:polysaccharide export outer membrane protein
MSADDRPLLSAVDVCKVVVNSRDIVWLTLRLAFFVGCCVCAPSVLRAQTPPPQPAEARPAANTDEYVLTPGDILSIKFFYNPELNENLPIRPDGRIALQFIGELPAAGLKVSELRSTLMERYRDVVRQPDLVVIVSGFGSQKIYVGGEVGRPGEIALVPGMTPLQAIIIAGGDRRTASMRNVVVLRDQGTETPMIMLVDIKKSLSKSAEAQDVRLQPRDIVFVPMSKIAKVDNFVNMYIKEVVPMSMVLGLYYNFGGLFHTP